MHQQAAPTARVSKPEPEQPSGTGLQAPPYPTATHRRHSSKREGQPEQRRDLLPSVFTEVRLPHAVGEDPVPKACGHTFCRGQCKMHCTKGPQHVLTQKSVWSSAEGVKGHRSKHYKNSYLCDDHCCVQTTSRDTAAATILPR